jgi:cellulose synthase/poly-beta-1,6-N-acetylglucosamine synthase-like glycosyltransferase
VVFWGSLFLILYTYAGYPLAIAFLGRVAGRGWRKAPWPAGKPPISVVMAVHNGVAMLPRQMEHLLGLDPALVGEVVVVSDGSTDGTAEILARATDARLRVILLEQQQGKSAAVNHGVEAARGEILLFVDIRPHVEDGALAALLENFADPTVGCVAGELLLNTGGQDAAAASVSGVYWKYEQWIRNCEAAVDSPTGVYGGFYAIRRALATPAPAGLILDDMFQPLSVIRQGYRSVLERKAYVTDTWPASSAGEFQRKVRTLAGNFQLIAEAPWVLSFENRVVFQLVSHKLLRLVVPWCFLGLLGSSFALGGEYGVFGWLQTCLWGLAAVSLKVKLPLLGKIGAPASALLVLNAAAVMGLYTFLFTRGPLWKIWSPTAAPTFVK